MIILKQINGNLVGELGLQGDQEIDWDNCIKGLKRASIRLTDIS